MYTEGMISCIVPVYNGEKYISKCIDSILKQTYQNFQIIIVNDGSTDASPNIIKKYENDNSCISVCTSDNYGPSHARNMGLEVAKGEYITFVDVDDTIPDDAFELMITLMENNSADIVYGKNCSQSIDKKAINKMNQNCKNWIWQGVEALENHLKDSPYTWSVSGALYSHLFIDGIRFDNDHGFAEDSFFNFLCYIKKPKVVLTEHILYYIFYSPNSLTRSPLSEKKIEDILFYSAKKKEILALHYPEYVLLGCNLEVKAKLMIYRNLSNDNSKRLKNLKNDIYSQIRHDCHLIIPSNKKNKVEKILIRLNLLPLAYCLRNLKKRFW